MVDSLKTSREPFVMHMASNTIIKKIETKNFTILTKINSNKGTIPQETTPTTDKTITDNKRTTFLEALRTIIMNITIYTIIQLLEESIRTKARLKIRKTRTLQARSVINP